MLKFDSIDSLLSKTSEIVGKTFGEIDTENYFERLSNDKGILGKIVETGFYGYPNNNKAEADFDNLGVELKVSGFTVTKKGLWSAKERISLSQINFSKIVEQEFQYSSLISKNRKILFIWYEFVKGGDPRDFVIRDYQLYDMTAIEPVIERDYLVIQDFVKKGLAHELSEGNSVVLGAATKGASG
ncbi:MutH/Sau3AI family endonuclease, partial [Exiguobacterium sp. B2(2022)]|uniref:MutH/Sau3AI family endonuclease n=1 Tax=Exiguobacterium sp. B2(2022) TaxID=2992755 RepID=UPI00237A5775